MKEPQKPAVEGEIELRPDGWERFEQAVDAAVKKPAMRRAPAAKPKERPASAGRVRVHKGRTRA
jgi:hypothetical protein